MTIIVCIDDQNGMMFNKRRQSQDRILRERLLQQLGNRRLWMTPYSAKQFGDTATIAVDDGYADKMRGDDACFVEDGALPLDKADELIVYRWNRRYPADRFFEADLKAWTLQATTEFAGSSHDNITEDHYTR